MFFKLLMNTKREINRSIVTPSRPQFIKALLISAFLFDILFVEQTTNQAILP